MSFPSGVNLLSSVSSVVESVERSLAATLRVRPGISVAPLGVEAPARRGARSERYLAYVSDEQRSPAGCIGGQSGTVIPGRALSPEC